MLVFHCCICSKLNNMSGNPVVKEIIIPVDVRTVWEAITSPSKMKEWYFDVNNFKLELGNEFFFFEPGDARKFRHVCEIQAIIPEREFQHTWTFPDYSDGVSVLTWELSDEGGKTRVRLTHEGLENFAEAGSQFARANFDAGWEEIITQILVNYLIK